MTRLLYGVQGTGNGHLSRSRLVIQHLETLGVTVDALVSGRAASDVPSLPGAATVLHREGLSFAVRRGRISYSRTVAALSPRRLVQDIRSLDVSGYDVIVSDYEPVTAWAGRRAGRDVIGLGHQYAFDADCPVAGANPVSRFVMRQFAPVTLPLGLHWQPYGPQVLPPIIDTDNLVRAGSHNAIVAYLPWEDRDRVVDVMRSVPDVEFRFYCAVDSARKIDNVMLCPISQTGFQHDLCGARAVVCNAGFELVSEALYLGLPVLVRPLAGQMEQLSNAFALEQAGMATVAIEIDSASVSAWLQNPLGVAPQRYPNVAAATAQWIVEGQAAAPETLAKSLWQGLAQTPRVASVRA